IKKNAEQADIKAKANKEAFVDVETENLEEE
ncbi:MAG: 30S ribosomal protein S6, partial [Bacteroidetes bacterium]